MTPIRPPNRRVRRHRNTVLRALRPAVLALGTLTACAVGPDYKPPDVRMPDQWNQNLTRGLLEGKADLRTWWTFLGDPVLNSLIDRARAGNLDVKQGVARLLEARAVVGIAAGEELPLVTAPGDLQRGRISEGTQKELGTARARTSTLYQLGLDASWELDLWGRIGRNVESADASLQASLEDYRDLLVSLYAEVATAYVDIRTLQSRIDAAEGNVRTQRQTLKLVSDRKRAQLASDLEIAQAQLNVSTTEALIPQLRQQLHVQLHRLSVLLGEEPTALYAELSRSAPIPQPPSQVAIGLPAELLRQRPDVRSAERQLASQTAQIGVATADLYPRLTLSGFLAFQKYGVTNFFNKDNIGFGLGPTVMWNVFDGGRIRSNIAAQDARTQQALFGYEQTVLSALSETQDSLVGYVQEGERRDILARSVKAASDSVRLVQSLYVAGLTDFQNVQDQQRSKFQQDDAYAQSQGLVVQDLIALYRALGGGWSEPETARPPGQKPPQPTAGRPSVGAGAAKS